MAPSEIAGLAEVDPFELPDWLGTAEVTWRVAAAGAAAHLVPGNLEAAEGRVPCDLLAVDRAYPTPVVPEPVRRAAHQAWRNGEVLLVEREGRTTLAVPGVAFQADRVLEALARFTKAVGARPERFVVALRLGAVREDG